jgi:hypothetical protein
MKACKHGLWRWDQTHCPRCEAEKAAARLLRKLKRVHREEHT